MLRPKWCTPSIRHTQASPPLILASRYQLARMEDSQPQCLLTQQVHMAWNKHREPQGLYGNTQQGSSGLSTIAQCRINVTALMYIHTHPFRNLMSTVLPCAEGGGDLHIKLTKIRKRPSLLSLKWGGRIASHLFYQP